MIYRLEGNRLDRQWRRGKRYSANELRWLARKRGLVFNNRDRGRIELVDKDNKLVAVFNRVEQGPKDEALALRSPDGPR